MPPRRRNWQSPPAVDAARVGALSQALDLAQAPTLVAHLRSRPLPHDVLTLIRLTAGCHETLASAATTTGRAPDFLLAAAEFYLRQVVCFPGADPCRVLGVPPHAPRSEMRRHMRELMLWLHPDRSRDAWNQALMRRVLEAWQVVDGAAPGRSGGTGPIPARARRVPAYRPSWISRPVPKAKPPAAAAGRHLLRVLRLVLVAAGMVVPALGTVGPYGLAAGLLRPAEAPSRLRATGRPAPSHASLGCRGRPCSA